MNLLFATGNRHKAREARDILKRDVERVDIDYPELQAPDLETIAEYGAEHAYRETGEPVFVEDSGLFVDPLDGFPGPYSSYAFDTIGNDGILRLLDDDRTARFRSVVAYRDETGTTTHAGEVAGRIARQQRGEEGFGYDPIFVPDGTDATFAQDPETKNRVSHRKKALQAFAHWLDAR